MRIEPAIHPLAETVVLLHGLHRTSRSLGRLARVLRDDGYAVINCDYPSTRADIRTLADTLFQTLAPRLPATAPVHFATHSMGGILLRVYLQKHAPTNLGRVVMLAPPNGGSEIVDRLGAFPLFRRINGPAGTQLGTGDGSLPRHMEPPNFAFGVIAGDRSVNPLFSCLIPGPDDGKVAVAHTRVAGMSDFVCMHVTHTFMMRNSRVIRQVRHFLKTGYFQHCSYAHTEGLYS